MREVTLCSKIHTLKPIIQYASLVGHPFLPPLHVLDFSKKKVLTKYVPSAAKLKTIECSPHFSYGSYDTQQFLSRSEKQSISRTAGSKILNVIQINFRLQKDKSR
jgi:hypothetical protein